MRSGYSLPMHWSSRMPRGCERFRGRDRESCKPSIQSGWPQWTRSAHHIYHSGWKSQMSTKQPVLKMYLSYYSLTLEVNYFFAFLLFALLRAIIFLRFLIEWKVPCIIKSAVSLTHTHTNTYSIKWFEVVFLEILPLWYSVCVRGRAWAHMRTCVCDCKEHGSFYPLDRTQAHTNQVTACMELHATTHNCKGSSCNFVSVFYNP